MSFFGQICAHYKCIIIIISLTLPSRTSVPGSRFHAYLLLRLPLRIMVVPYRPLPAYSVPLQEDYFDLEDSELIEPPYLHEFSAEDLSYANDPIVEALQRVLKQRL